MSVKWLLPATVVIAAAGVTIPGAASAQSFGFSVSSGYPPPQYYDPGYAPGYYVPAYPEYRRDWRDHERWEREEARRRYWQRERWEERQDARQPYWRDEHRWRDDHHEHRGHHDG